MAKKTFQFLPVILMSFLLAGQSEAAEKLVVYSARKEHLIKPLFDAYSKESGTEIQFVTDKAGPLLERLRIEGDKTQADILITVDAGNLWHAVHEGILQKVDSEILFKNIPAHLRDPGNYWFGFSVRARTIIYNTESINPSELTTYEDLGDDKWKGRLCLRTSKKVYNQSLVAMMIHEYGLAETQKIVEGWVKNLAAPVFSDDTAVLKAVAAGQCDVGIVNTYYYGRLIKKEPDLPLALFWPNQKTNGVHVNVSGAGLVKHSRHQEEAVRFLEWLSREKAQHLFADANMEYPANPDMEPDPIVAAWGSFKQNLINVSQAGALQQEAVKLMDRAGYK